MDVKERRALTNSPYPTRIHSSEHPEAVPSATCAAALLRLDGVDLVAGEAFVPTRLQQDLTKVGSVYGPPAEAGRRETKPEPGECDVDTSASRGDPGADQGDYNADTSDGVDDPGVGSEGLANEVVARMKSVSETGQDLQDEYALTSEESLNTPSLAIPATKAGDSRLFWLRGSTNVDVASAVHGESPAVEGVVCAHFTQSNLTKVERVARATV
ncbi:hypothetical protein B0H11DRAFT_1910572 [Mycena galericulata]|nr:hypothetical protein B0H11DRAFT_1910572 [Mycena galericulata]